MRRMTRLITWILFAILLAGCSGNTNNSVPQNPAQAPAPAPTQEDDGVLDILMVGNSFSFYFTDELYGMMDASGIEARVCNVYYSGCKLEQHWTWWKTGENQYDFITQDASGRNKTEEVNLEYCVKASKWDVITLQEGSAKMRRGDPATELANSKLYRDELYGYLSQIHPEAKLYWHHTWAYQVGYDRDGYQVDAAEQAAYHDRQRNYALGVCEENGVERIPSGDAWKLVRDGGYDNLCARLAKDNGLGDFYHDGDIGGGQYLNACVWFEVLTGQSCVGNAFRPEYELSEELINTLQNAAHQAVENMKTGN